MNNESKIIKDQKGTALFMTLMVMLAVLTIVLGASSIILPNLIMGRNQSNSTRAYLAAEAGAERVLGSIWGSGTIDTSACLNNECINFSSNNCSICSAPGVRNILPDAGSSYWVIYSSSSTPGGADIILNCIGEYYNSRRNLQLMFSK